MSAVLPRLTPLIAEANAIYLKKIEDLAALPLQLGLRRVPLRPAITPASILSWLLAVRHEVSERTGRRNFGDNGCHATAYYQSQTIRYSERYCQWQLDDSLLLDLVLHELGHLFTYHFWRVKGHGYEWKQLGATVGYAWVGDTSDERRRSYIVAAKREALLRELGRVVGTTA